MFTSSLEQALLDGSIDVAVHSLKDLPVVIRDGLQIQAYIQRHSAGDVLLIKNDKVISTDPVKLVSNCKIGTGSPRRQSQLIEFDNTIIPLDIRGNIDTRISRLNLPHIDGIVLAKAVFERSEFDIPRNITIIDLPLSHFPTTPGQGAIAVQTRVNELNLLNQLNHQITKECVEAERMLLLEFGGGCELSLGLTIQNQEEVSLIASKTIDNWNASMLPTLQRYYITATSINQVISRFKSYINKPENYITNDRINKFITITRSMEDSTEYTAKFQQIGLKVDYLPLQDFQIRYDIISDSDTKQKWLDCTWVVITSQRAIPFLFQLHTQYQRKGYYIATVGKKTASIVRKYNLPVHLVADGNIKSLQEYLNTARQINPGKVLYLSGKEITALPSEDSIRLTCYQTTGRNLPKTINTDLILVFSQKSAEILSQSYSPNIAKVWIAIGETTGAYLKNLNYNTIIATEPTPEGVIKALEEIL